MNTIKKYYMFPDTQILIAKVINIYGEYIELDSTIAFPEGGGQEGDHGEICLKINPNVKINFIDTQLIDASKIDDIDYPDCKIGGRIIHKINAEHLPIMNKFKCGEEVLIKIDSDRRKLLTQSHSATHIMYMAIDKLKSNLVNNILGCHIKPEGGRLDFLTDYRFTQDEIKIIEETANSIIEDNLPTTIIADSKYPDIRYWICANYKIPCGGTHTKNTGEIPLMKISRKSIGTGKERVLFRWK